MSDKKISQLTGATTPLAGTEVLPIVQSGVTKKVTVNDLTAGKDVNANVFTAASWMFVTPSTDTNNALYRASNAAGTVYMGIDNSAGGLSGSAYSLVLRHAGNYPISLWNGSTEKVNIGTTGDVNVKLGNLVIGTAGKGIDFSADPSAAGMTSELLDDYEEGTWTPTLAFTSGSVTYVTQLGTYTKVGNQVTVNYWIRVNTVSSPSGATYVSSLPFNSGATGTRPASAIRVNNFAITGYCVGWMSTSTNQILLNDIQSGNAVTIDGSKVVGNTEIGGSFTYLIA